MVFSLQVNFLQYISFLFSETGALPNDRIRKESTWTFHTINYFAVLAAALSTFVLGGLWYSPLLFGKAWMRANGFTEADLQTFSKARMFGWSFLFSFVMALNLAMFLAGPTTNVTWGMAAGGLAGFGWVAMAIAIVGRF